MFLFKNRRPETLEGAKINLRPLHRGDFDRIREWLADEELMELAFGAPHTPFRLYNLLPAYKREIEENTDSFQAIETKTGELIGFCSRNIFGIESRARIGILIGNRDYWNLGYGREAVGLLLRYLFLEKKLKTVELDTAVSNRRAQRCFEACGFQAVHKEWCEVNERLWYEIDRDRFLALPEKKTAASI